MLTVFLRTLKNRWRMIVALAVIGVLVQWMYIALYPTYSETFNSTEDLFEQMPQALKEAFNIEDFNIDTIEKFLNLEMYSFFWPILTVLLVLSLSGSALAGEVERETVQLTAAQPVSRSAHFFGHFLAGAASFTLFHTLSTFAVFPLARIHGIDVQPMNHLVIWVMGMLFGLGLLGVSAAVAAWLSDKGKVYVIMSGALLAMYAANIVSGLQDALDPIKYGSIFYYFDTNAFIVKAHYETTAVLVFAGMLIVGVLVGWYRWTKRDLV